ncbi:MAG: MarR family transcriptional regulator [Bacteroidetes bacterium]|nr:MarR family transcriptional regulator [Bacteroidota bacterium]MBS1739425.1 MarR family transcriptional regulator [Bacteroidota bacterium]
MKLEDALKSTRFESERQKATLNIVYTAYWIKCHFSNAMKELGLTMEQFNVMRILRGKHPNAMCVRDIGNRMVETSSNVPRIIDRLVAKNMVNRTTSKSDKRETLIELTEHGLSQLDIASKLVSQTTNQIIGISEVEAQTLNTILEKVRLID